MLRKQRNNSAFTIVELLVVIVVIGILAAITSLSYIGTQNKAIVASLISDLDKASKLVSMHQTINGVYPAALSEANNGEGVPASPGTIYDNYYPTSTGFCITARKDNISYRITNSSSARIGVCSGPQRDTLSLIKWNTWTLGAGSVAGYSANGDGNSRIMDTNPWGISDIVWDISDQDADSNADGGWNSSNFTIDNTEMHRFSTFVRRKNIGNGSFYLGTRGYPDAVLNRRNGVSNANPYFCSRAWWGNVNQWYLVIGYVWPAGSGVGDAMPDSGIYTMWGEKIISNSDYVWQSTTTSSNHRSYLFYSTDVTTNQQFYQPRVDIVDGTEPTISEVLQDTF